MPSTYTLIASNVLGSSAASVTFSAIPSTYTDLVLRTSIRSDRAAGFDNIDIRFNGDSATNYSRTIISGDGSSASSSRTSSASNWDAAIVDGNTATSNTFSNGELYIPNYTSTSSRAGSYFGAQEDNSATAYIRGNAYLYRGSSAISSIAMTPSNGTNWLSGSSFYLYGIKSS
jgi:hypothetical protein